MSARGLSARGRRRCAVYTRKSSEEGLEQDFNSLHAQREACEAFIVSQKHEGWGAVSTCYDDGGFSGGSMSRPALERLLDDVKGGRIDVVIVYKVDRLTRSLTDFARIVEIFDAHGVSFVSVTQQFNTTSSMGRLTLNVLLSFAQFEREVTAERIRDKIAASKRKGMWMGGLPPLGYDVQDKHLVVNPAEAETVGELFRLYREIGSVRSLKEEVDRRGLVTKRRSQSGRVDLGGKPFSRGHLYALLSNPLYIGKVRHRGVLYEGQHRPILDEETFQAVQERLAAQAPQRLSQTNGRSLHLLTGLIYDETGDRLSPTHAVKHGRRYRYYVSHRLMEARRKERDGWRLPAAEIEQLVVSRMVALLGDGAALLDLSAWKAPVHQTEWGMQRAAEGANTLSAGKSDAIAPLLQTLLHRIEVCPDGIRLQLFPETVRRWLADEGAASAVEPEGQEPRVIRIQASLQRRGVEARLVLSNGRGKGKSPDANLIAVVAKAHRCLSLLTEGGFASMEDVAKVVSLPASEVSRILPLAFLAPDIVQAILSGKQPVTLTAKRLKRLSCLPQDWVEQRQLLGFV